MPVWNGERYIRAALDSLIGQTYTDFEVVISDNASSDATGDICREYAARDDRIRYLRLPKNVGAGPNHNAVFERSTGEYFKWAAYDDICEPTFLERCVDALDADSEVVIAYPRTRLIDDDGEPLGAYDKDCPWAGPSPSVRLSNLLLSDLTLLHKCYPIYGLMRASVLRRTKLIAPYNDSDAGLLVEMALRGSFFEVPDYLFWSRRHAGSSLQANATPQEVAAWFEPSRGGREPLRRGRLFLGYLGSVNRVPMPTAERLACYRVLAAWLAKDRMWRVIGGELKMKGRELAHRAPAARQSG